MTVDSFTVYTCNLGWRTLSFLKIGTRGGLAGWSEFTEDFGNQGLAGVVDSLRHDLLGRDARPVARIAAELAANRNPAPGGLNRQAVAAVENALVDLRARSLDVSVSELVGGPYRDRIPVYWSHCGTYRLGDRARMIGVEPIDSYSALTSFAASLRGSGISTVKTNMLTFDDPELGARPHPWTRRPSAAGRQWDERCREAIVKTVSAFRSGFGADIDLILDLNTGYRKETVRLIEQDLTDFDLAWIELDGLGPAELADLRARSRTALASGESLLDRAAYRPYLEASSFDVCIVDVMWNGILESLRVAADADLRSLTVAPHNFYGHLSTYISAQFSAAIPNIDILEVDIDGVPWRDDLTPAPDIQDGFLVLPDGPGWGVDVNEDALEEHAVEVRR